MANYADLIATIQEVIKTNGNNEITGALMQQSLVAMINALGAGYQFIGIAQESTNPGTPDQKVFYISGAGTYPNFNSAVIQQNHIGIFKYNGSWTIETTRISKDYEPEIDEIKNLGFTAELFRYSTFTAQTPNITLTTPIRPSQIGDFIEIKVNANGTNGAFLRHQQAYNVPIIRYSAQHTIQIRFNTTEQFTYQNVNSIDWSTTQIIRIEIYAISTTAVSYKIFVDGIQVGTIDIASAIQGYEQIGYNSVMTLYYIKVKIAGIEKNYRRFSQMTGAVGITDTIEFVPTQSVAEINEELGIVKQEVAGLHGNNMRWEFIKDSHLWNMESNFYIMVRIKDNYYIRIAIGYYINPNNTSPNGYWRMERVNLDQLIDGEWNTVQSQILVAGENEFVLSWLAGTGYNYQDGFSGGFHFGETINVSGAWVEFIVDGKPIQIPTKDFPQTNCKSFVYREFSPIYQHNNDTIAAWHLKETEITNDGYRCRNQLFLVQDLDFYAFGGICCVSRYLGEYAMPEDVNTITDMGDGSTTIANQFISNGNRILYEGHGIITVVESKVLFGPPDSECSRWVWNGPSYTKYYRRTPDIAGNVNNRLVTEQIVSFRMK